MKKAMLVGADFAKAMGDDDTAATYAATAASIDATLYDSHYNGEYVLETSAREKVSRRPRTRRPRPSTKYHPRHTRDTHATPT